MTFCWWRAWRDNRHRRWSADGTWAHVLTELQRGCDRIEERWVGAVDSTVVRAHHHAAGARHEPPSDVPVQVQGVWVRPGDRLYADADGIVVMPA